MMYLIYSEIDGVRKQTEVKAESYSEAADKLYKKCWWTFAIWNVLKSFMVFSGPSGWAEIEEVE